MSLQSFLRVAEIFFFLSKQTRPGGSPSVQSWKWVPVSLGDAGIPVHFSCKLLGSAIHGKTAPLLFHEPHLDGNPNPEPSSGVR